MMDEHQHHFEAKFTRINGNMEIENPCMCTGCDQHAFIHVDGYKVIVTVVSADAKMQMVTLPPIERFYDNLHGHESREEAYKKWILGSNLTKHTVY